MGKSRKSLPLKDWPESCRRDWARAIKQDSILDEPGYAAHWMEKSRLTAIEAFGRWLLYLFKNHQDLDLVSRCELITHERMHGFVEELKSTVSPSTVAIEITHLYRAIRVMYPEQDWRWLREWATHLENVGRKSRKKIPPPVNSRTLFELGLELMNLAESQDAEPIILRYRTYRDGLLISLLAARPIRRRTLALLRVDKQLVRFGDQWRLVLSAEDVKNKRPTEFPLPEVLSGKLDRYFFEFWSKVRADENIKSVWLSSTTGKPLSDSRIYDSVKKRLRQSLGISVSLHDFRQIVATTVSREDPEHVMTVAPILGHATLDMAYRHYIKSQGREASLEYQAVISRLRQ